jgi:2'-5' RNA ligase
VTRRLFVALEPDDEVRAGLVAAAAELRRAAGPLERQVRWAAPAALHLTLRFLGDVAEPAVEAVARAVAEAAAAGRPLALQIRGAGAFPSPSRARVLWLGLEGDLAPLAALAAGLSTRLVAAGVPPEARPFSPHLTVGRARAPGGVRGLGAALGAPLGPLAWAARELVLFESHLGPGGARHVVLRRAPLGGAAAAGGPAATGGPSAP